MYLPRAGKHRGAELGVGLLLLLYLLLRGWAGCLLQDWCAQVGVCCKKACFWGGTGGVSGCHRAGCP